MFSIKVVLQDEVRRVQVSEECGSEGSYLKLQETVRNMFPVLQNSQFSLIWQDDEGDKVTASSDGELHDALQVMSCGGSIPRFTVKIVEVKASESSETHVIHYGITCDECGVSPIVGNRFKCTVRDDFDLCAACESRQVQPYPMTKITTSQFPAGGCPRFGGRFGGPPGGRGGCHGRGGFRGFFGGPPHHRPPPPPHGPRQHPYHGPHGHGHGGRGGRGGWGWGGPRRCPRFDDFEAFPEAEGTYAAEPPVEGQDFHTRRGPVQTPWGPADIVHAYLDGKDILSNLMGALGVSKDSPAAAAPAAATTEGATSVPASATTSSTEVPTAQPLGRTLAEAIAEARSHGHHHGHEQHHKRVLGRRGWRGRHHQQDALSEGVTRDLNDEDEALQTAIQESLDESPKPSTDDVEEVVVSDTASEADGVIVTAPEAVAVPVQVETAPVAVPPIAATAAVVEPVAVAPPAATPTHEQLCAVWSRELSVLASMGFVDTSVLVPLLQTHVVTPTSVMSSPTAHHMEGMQAVVSELLGMMGVMF